ncbi:PLAC8 family protein, partial [Acinetobacter baumannii]
MAEEEEQQKLLMEDVTVLDFDVLCSTVAMQAQKGKWVNLNENFVEEDNNNLVSEYQQKYGDGVFRMWEGELVYDCFDDRRIALQSACCPSYRFGKNMKRAGQGSCFLQASVHLFLIIVALFNLLVFLISKKRCFLYMAIASTISIGAYVGFYRMQMRKKFNIKGSDNSVDDCVYHLICPCCTLSQESRTLEMNNVQDGIWHG